MLGTPATVELSRFRTPPVVADRQSGPVDVLGYLHVIFTGPPNTQLAAIEIKVLSAAHAADDSAAAATRTNFRPLSPLPRRKTAPPAADQARCSVALCLRPQS